MIAGRRHLWGVLLILGLSLGGPGTVLPGLADDAILPPELPWAGQSRSLVAAAGDPWITPAERDGLLSTPTYAETVAYLERLVAASPQLAMTSLGKSYEGRDVWLVIASAEGVRTPAALRANGKPTLMAEAGIHAGEIDGKDAGLMLLRDLTVGGRQKELLAKANFLFVPILNVDGHERRSPYGRVNQRGPREMGWRTTSRNLNLNRDWTKLDAPETRAVVAALDAWQPDLFYDLHVTDGADYQYDITYGFNGPAGYSPAIAGWLGSVLRPAADRDLKAWGHVPGPLVFLRDPGDATQGNMSFTASPRFSNGYGDLRHLPAVLVENHSLKPYPQRVLGTYVLLASTLRTLASDGVALRTAIAADAARRPAQVPLSFTTPNRPPQAVDFLAVEARKEMSTVSGKEKVVYTGKPITVRSPVIEFNEPADLVRRPRAYWLPPTYPEVIDRLAAHGIRLEPQAAERTLEVTMYRLVEPKLAERTFEGRVGLSTTTTTETRRQSFPAGSVRVPTDQPLGELAMALLEPASGDSFLQWGFFAEVLERTEYIEDYAVEPLAAKMLAASPQLATEFQQALAADPKLAADPDARLRWFYQRSPYWDERWLLYPVAREEAP